MPDATPVLDPARPAGPAAATAPGVPAPAGVRPAGRGRRALTLVVVATVMAGALALWLDNRVRLDQATATLSQARWASRTAAGQVRVLHADLGAATARRNQSRATARTVAAADAALVPLEQADGVAASFESASAHSLTACLDGVQQAFSGIAQQNLAAAVGALSAASTPCVVAEGSAPYGLSYPFDFPDPSVIRVGHEYYAYGTNSAAGAIQVIESPDLTSWTVVGDALPSLPWWAQAGETWGPSVLQIGDSFDMYVALAQSGTGHECIALATSTSPTGPFTDSSFFPVTCFGPGGATDPYPFVGQDGHPYLAFATVAAPGTAEPTTVYSAPLSADGTTLAGAPSALLAPDQPWQGGVVEGPAMLLTGGRYFLFYSANNWRTAAYAVGVADCAGPLGPCTDGAANPVLASGPGLEGPGGPAFVSGPHGTLWMAFHAWLPGATGFPNPRPLFFRRVALTPAGQPALLPPVAPHDPG